MGVIFGVIEFVVAWWIFRMSKRGTSLGLFIAFTGILAEFLLPLIFKGFPESDSVEEIILYSLSIILLLKAWPYLR